MAWSSWRSCPIAIYLGLLSGGFGKLSSDNAALSAVGAGAIASGCSTFPLQKIGVPATDVNGGKVVALKSPVLSAVRPPQPPAAGGTFDGSAIEVCHSFC